jgi:hypothetical protein
MRIIRDATEEEVVLAFLEAEVDSPNHTLPDSFRALVEDADLSDAYTNYRRRAALYAWREPLFEGFPTEVTWKLVRVTAAELSSETSST